MVTDTHPRNAKEELGKFRKLLSYSIVILIILAIISFIFFEAYMGIACLVLASSMGLDASIGTGSSVEKYNRRATGIFYF